MRQKIFVILLFLLVPGMAFGQDNQEINAEFFQPSPGYNFLGVREALLLPDLSFQLGAIFNIADDPVILVDGNDQNLRAKIVDTQTALDLTAALGLFNFVEVGIALPIAVALQGEGQSAIGGNSQLSGGALGDLRLAFKLKLLGNMKTQEGFFLTLIPEFSLPTGNGEKLFGAPSSGTLFALAGEWKSSRFAIGANIGTRLQQASQFVNIDQGSNFEIGGGLSYAVTDRVLLLGDINGYIPLGNSLDAGQAPAEARAGAKFQLAQGIWLPVGAGFGITNGIGAPDFRVLAGILFSPENSDLDGDGIFGAKDLCPEEAEDIDNVKDEDGCPDDNDEDGIADNLDACPNTAGLATFQGCPDSDEDQIADNVDSCPTEAEDLNGIQDDDGCPDDRDGDLVADQSDACPEEAGIVELKGCPDRDGDKVADKDDICADEAGLAELQGCPDKDGDKIADNTDSCPEEAEDFDKFEDEDGCPDNDNDNDKIADKDDVCINDPEDYKGKVEGCPENVRATVSGENIIILDIVYFATGKADIKSRSFAILDDVAKILVANPQITKLQIEGHTDDVGNAEMNQKLSEERAKSVREYIVNKGVEETRLLAQGFGETNPLEPIEGKRGRKLRDARSQNRRVAFTILERSE